MSETINASAEKSIVFNIQKFSINDGPGIRTTVFLKGCMLNCIWCHNPESKSAKPQLMFRKDRCIGCGACLKACPRGVHSIGENGEHLINREACIACGKCVEACVGALEIAGKEMSVEEILKEVMKDKVFYDNSGGGMTISGGDPLMRPRFTLALLKGAKEKGLHTCIETSGFARWEDIEAMVPYVDLFLWDVKESDSANHKEYTGVPNERILENLHKLDAAGAGIILRCPIIPGYNDREEHLKAIGKLAEELVNVQRVDVEPYHPLGKSKCESLGKAYPLEELTFPADETVKEWIRIIAAQTSKPVQKA